jgi:hypothetical protein
VQSLLPVQVASGDPREINPHDLIIETAFLPATVKLMGEAFTDAWGSIEHEYKALDETEIEAARLALAKAVVLFAGLGNSERVALKAKELHRAGAPRVVRECAPTCRGHMLGTWTISLSLLRCEDEPPYAILPVGGHSLERTERNYRDATNATTHAKTTAALADWLRHAKSRLWISCDCS